jgi:hypothetical protein
MCADRVRDKARMDGDGAHERQQRHVRTARTCGGGGGVDEVDGGRQTRTMGDGHHRSLDDGLRASECECALAARMCLGLLHTRFDKSRRAGDRA